MVFGQAGLWSARRGADYVFLVKQGFDTTKPAGPGESYRAPITIERMAGDRTRGN